MGRIGVVVIKLLEDAATESWEEEEDDAAAAAAGCGGGARRFGATGAINVAGIDEGRRKGLRGSPAADGGGGDASVNK